MQIYGDKGISDDKGNLQWQEEVNAVVQNHKERRGKKKSKAIKQSEFYWYYGHVRFVMMPGWANGYAIFGIQKVLFYYLYI